MSRRRRKCQRCNLLDNVIRDLEALLIDVVELEGPTGKLIAKGSRKWREIFRGEEYEEDE